MAYPCHADRRGRRRKDASRRDRGHPATALCAGAALGLLAVACASFPPPEPSNAGPGRFEIERDAFAFPNYSPAGRVRAFRLYTSPLF